MAAIAVRLVSIWMDIFKDGTEMHCKRKISSLSGYLFGPCGEAEDDPPRLLPTHPVYVYPPTVTMVTHGRLASDGPAAE